MGGHTCKKIYKIIIEHIDDHDLFYLVNDCIKRYRKALWENDYCLSVLCQIDSNDSDAMNRARLRYFIGRYGRCDGSM